MTKNSTLLRLEYVLLDEAANWEWLDNPKLHDTEAIITSIQRYGFADPPKFDASLPSNAGQGAIIGGNGRTAALVLMRDRGLPRPAGIAETTKGEWAIPVLFGNDLPSRERAEAFALDHNNLTMTGGTLTAQDAARMYTVDGYNDLLARLRDAETLPVTVSSQDVDDLLARLVVTPPPVVVSPIGLFEDDEEEEDVPGERPALAPAPAPSNGATPAPAPTTQPALADLADDLDDEDERGEPDSGSVTPDETAPAVALANTQALIGRYTITILRDDYLKMVEDIRQTAGFEQAKIIAEIRRRLGIPEEQAA